MNTINFNPAGFTLPSMPPTALTSKSLETTANKKLMALIKSMPNSIQHESYINEKINALMKDGAQLSYSETSDTAQWTTLHFAVIKKDARLLEILLESYKKNNCKDNPFKKVTSNNKTALDLLRFEIEQMKKEIHQKDMVGFPHELRMLRFLQKQSKKKKIDILTDQLETLERMHTLIQSKIKSTCKTQEKRKALSPKKTNSGKPKKLKKDSFTTSNKSSTLNAPSTNLILGQIMKLFNDAPDDNQKHYLECPQAKEKLLNILLRSQNQNKLVKSASLLMKTLCKKSTTISMDKMSEYTAAESLIRLLNEFDWDINGEERKIYEAEVQSRLTEVIQFKYHSDYKQLSDALELIEGNTWLLKVFNQCFIHKFF